MNVEIHFNGFIPLMYRQNFITQMLYAWVSLQRRNGNTVHDAILDFQEWIGGSEEHLSYESLHQSYYRCIGAIREIDKTIKLPSEDFVTALMAESKKKCIKKETAKQQQVSLFR